MATETDIEALEAERRRICTVENYNANDLNRVNKKIEAALRRRLAELLSERAALQQQVTGLQLEWVIEHRDSSPSAPVYFTGKRHAAMLWSSPGDHVAACRFARKEDAERIAHFAGFYEPNVVHRICEHAWIGSGPSASTEGKTNEQ